MNTLIEGRDGRVAKLVLNRPERLNALTDELIGELIGALERLNRDPEVGVILISGAGRAFCAGGDVKGIAGMAHLTYETRLEMLRWKQRVALHLQTSSKVVVTALRGAVMGAGLSMALSADFRIVSRTAKFRTAFSAVGFSGDFGSSWNLSRLVGPAKARELMMLNPTLDAEAAQALGLVTELVEDEALDGAAQAFAARLASGPTVAFGYMKRNLHLAETAALAEQLDLEAVHQTRTAFTDDHAEAVKAFAEDRPPQFAGR